MSIKTLQKSIIMTDVSNVLNEAVSQRNKKAKTYSYVAKLSNYISQYNMSRTFENSITNLQVSGGNWSLLVSTAFLNQLKPGEIIEIGVNLKTSNSYSDVSKSYFVVVQSNAANIELYSANTALRAFQKQAELFG